MKKLYRAVTEVEVFFLAEEGEAEALADEFLEEEVKTNGFYNSPVHVRPVSKPQERGSWSLNSLVYGAGDTEVSLKEALEQFVPKP